MERRLPSGVVGLKRESGEVGVQRAMIYDAVRNTINHRHQSEAYTTVRACQGQLGHAMERNATFNITRCGTHLPAVRLQKQSRHPSRLSRILAQLTEIAPYWSSKFGKIPPFFCSSRFTAFHCVSTPRCENGCRKFV